MNKLDLLRTINFGHRVAEDEINDLEKYFIETDQWQKIYDGHVDIVYGAKGTGKSALYTLLTKKEGELFDRGVLIAPAENIRGATVFKQLISAPPPDEMSFIFWWKLYCLALYCTKIREYGIQQGKSTELIRALEGAGILSKENNLSSIFKAVIDYVKNFFSKEPSSTQYAISIDISTGNPTFSQKREYKNGLKNDLDSSIPIDELLSIANESLQLSSSNIWILFDRLDVAFADSRELERNALRALFRAYNDLKKYDNICIKIFVRDDIWKRITSGGFTEASHITKTITIQWDNDGLLNLIAKRLISNNSFAEALNVNTEKFDSEFIYQQDIVYSLLPLKIDEGKNPITFDWMVSRIKDGSGISAPREFIHLFEILKTLQIKKLERGELAPPDKILFDKSLFKQALIDVSKVRYEQTFCSEYPELSKHTNLLKGEKAEQNIMTLSRIWTTDNKTTYSIAEKLVEVGFFEKKGEKNYPRYWVPFLYRGALGLIQGKAQLD